MRPTKTLALTIMCAACALTLSGCKQVEDAGSEDDTASESSSTSSSSASVSSSSDGEDSVAFSINTDGFSVDVDVPIDDITTDNANGRAEGLYPGSKVTGINIESNNQNGKSQSQVAIRFTAAASKETVADWFMVQMPEQGGTAARKGNIISGTTDDGEPYVLTLNEAGDSTKGVLKINTD